ncbi:hypothetical protein ACWEKT_05155 [Nocardia takedensis]
MVDGEWPTAKSSEGVRPPGVSDATVEALGKLSEALEAVERARGHLYSLHQLIGGADLMLSEAADLFDEAGHDGWAGRIREELIGLNLIEGRWSFQMVEEFDDGYWSSFRAAERAAREELAGGVRHVFEAELKERRRTKGRVGHEAGPPGS